MHENIVKVTDGLHRQGARLLHAAVLLNHVVEVVQLERPRDAADLGLSLGHRLRSQAGQALQYLLAAAVVRQ